MKNVLAWGLVASVALLTGCNKEATGQVAAVVNGEEITLQEVNSELASMGNIPENADRKQVQQAALQRIIERRLLAQAARGDGLDQTPEFLMRRRQLEDALLVQLLGQTAARGSEVPSQRAVDNFMKENPTIFNERTIYALDRIQFPVPQDTAQLRQLEDDHSMDAVAEQLRSLGIQFTRGEGALDSARIAPEMLARIRSLPAGEPFILPEGGNVTVAVITGETKQPITGEQARPAAIDIMRNRSLAQTLQERLKAQRASAEIEYQSGFAPPAPRASPTPAQG